MSSLKQICVAAHYLRHRDNRCDNCCNVHVIRQPFTGHNSVTLKLDYTEAINPLQVIEDEQDKCHLYSGATSKQISICTIC